MSKYQEQIMSTIPKQKETVKITYVTKNLVTNTKEKFWKYLPLRKPNSKIKQKI